MVPSVKTLGMSAKIPAFWGAGHLLKTAYSTKSGVNTHASKSWQHHRHTHRLNHLMLKIRPVFVVSDRTGITAETLSNSLLTQFPNVRFDVETLPFIDTAESVEETVEKIAAAASEHGIKPLVFTTFVDVSHRHALERAPAMFIDLFDTFIQPLELELGVESSHSIGRTHGVVDTQRYTSRISAINYSVHCDDGLNTRDYAQADVVMLGVSRSGKTPTCLYLALHFGVFAANYPLDEDDFERDRLPAPVLAHKDKLYALTIDAARLSQIRQERRGTSNYAALKQCAYEIKQAETLFKQHGIPIVNSGARSVEEISAIILQQKNLRRSAVDQY